MSKLIAKMGILIHKLKTKHKVSDIGNEERVVMKCECGTYWSWDR